MESTRPSIAFFGATGGCASTTLVKALQDRYKCSALARTPSKLEKLLETTHNIPRSTIEANLTIVQGNVKDVRDVKRALLNDGAVVDIVVSGIGASPKLVANLNPVAMDDPNVCEDGMKTVVEALRSLKEDHPSSGPTVVTISTTGISDGARDVPWAIYPLYHYALAVPHQDKKKMEDILIAASQSNDYSIGGFVVIRPTLLRDSPAKGAGAVKVGWERPKSVRSDDQETAPGPALGYSISRADVGNWIFEEVVRGSGKWNGRCVSLAW